MNLTFKTKAKDQTTRIDRGVVPSVRISSPENEENGSVSRNSVAWFVLHWY
jgi:hypothetical protein